MMEIQKISEGAVKIIASIASLLKIYQYIFLKGHMFNELMKKEKSDDKKGGLSGHGFLNNYDSFKEVF